MALQPPYRRRPVRVALCIADRALRARVVEVCKDAGIAVAGSGTATGADIVLADHPVETAAHVIALTPDRQRNTLHAARPAGMRAVVPADIDAATLGAVVAVVAAGLVVMPHDDVAGGISASREATGEKISGKKISGSWAEPADETDHLAIVLTPREREVLALLTEGASNKEIARALAVSVHTAKFHVASLTEKLGARSRAEAIAIAIRAGLVMV